MDRSQASALVDLQMHWDEAYVITLDGDIWSARYRSSADELRAHTSSELRELIRSDYAYRQKADLIAYDPGEDPDEDGDEDGDSEGADGDHPTEGAGETGPDSGPVQSSPVPGPVQSSPVQSSPAQSSPAQSDPAQSGPVQSGRERSGREQHDDAGAAGRRGTEASSFAGLRGESMSM